MIEWGRVPWSLWIYSAVVLTGTILVEVTAHAPVSAKALFVAVMLAWLYVLLRGVRWAWFVTVGIYLLSLMLNLISGSLHWRGIAVSLVGLILFLLPLTRLYFFDLCGGEG
jgi:hypothetical protein